MPYVLRQPIRIMAAIICYSSDAVHLSCSLLFMAAVSLAVRELVMEHWLEFADDHRTEL